MSKPVIRAENMGKLYRIGERHRYKMLRDSLTQAFTVPFKKLKEGFRLKEKTSDDFWALKDVSFEIEKGEVVGVIGRNGAGKSTLLKILSRITPPTEGYAEVCGRTRSLLEVGTGFHPELTGRDNIYLNGAILGMRKVEIDHKFDEIVSFAEMEKFIDTPLKHYSSGMSVRLAFAVAAHLEPEILLVDEVLAVGDVAFQKKCLGKMEDVTKEGRTVLFVSHQLNQIRRLCRRCIWLDGGRVKNIGNTLESVGAYELVFSSAPSGTTRDNDNERVAARFLRWGIIEPPHEQTNILIAMGHVTMRFILKVNRPICNGIHGIALFNNESQLIWGTCTRNLKMDVGIHEFIYEFPFLPLKPSAYFWQVSLYDDNGLLDIWDCIPELIVATEPLTDYRDEWAGILNIPCKFNVQSSG